MRTPMDVDAATATLLDAIRGRLAAALDAAKPLDPVARTPEALRAIRDDLHAALSDLDRLETSIARG